MDWGNGKYEKFPLSDLEYVSLLENIRWGEKAVCPYCGSSYSRKLKGEARYQCNDCFTSYSVTVKTLFHRTRIPLKKWFFIIYLLLVKKEEATIRELSKELELNKNTVQKMKSIVFDAYYAEDELLIAIIMFFLQNNDP